jgi:hypothetical protein
VVLTAGPTYEAIDTVRGITNISSGKMGYALARACRDAGADVTLISGPTGMPAPIGMTRINVDSARQMHDSVMQTVGAADIFISVAAVADYRVKNRSEHKIKKGAGLPVIELEENPDILATVASLPAAPFCVGFAAESQNLLEFAESKRKKSGCRCWWPIWRNTPWVRTATRLCCWTMPEPMRCRTCPSPPWPGPLSSIDPPAAPLSRNHIRPAPRQAAACLPISFAGIPS